MSPLEKKKIEVELLKVTAAKEDMRLKLLEIDEQIERLNIAITVQEKREIELKEKLQ